MSKAMVCDQCGDSIPLNDRGDNPDGEDGAWIEVRTTFGRYDLCTRSCVVQLMEDDDFAEQVNKEAEVIAEIAGAIRDGQAATEDDE